MAAGVQKDLGYGLEFDCKATRSVSQIQRTRHMVGVIWERREVGKPHIKRHLCGILLPILLTVPSRTSYVWHAAGVRQSVMSQFQQSVVWQVSVGIHVGARMLLCW
jgi:hypothetical protein